jgi:hypothetical protein
MSLEWAKTNIMLDHDIVQVTELLYSRVGNYVGTLEGKRGKKGASVRVYVNWDDPKVEGAPLRPRIASRVTPSMQSQEVTLDMIEFPQRDSPLQIAVCPGTGNLIVAATNVMVRQYSWLLVWIKGFYVRNKILSCLT